MDVGAGDVSCKLTTNGEVLTAEMERVSSYMTVTARSSPEPIGEVPDPDTIKMFVGQIPKTWDEGKLKEYFEEFGSVYQLSVLKDKEMDVSRGCCFVTFFHRRDAINAQNALHNIRTFPGLSHPVQMKPADVENRNERKLFIGMLNKSMNENDVREMFKEFGPIEDCSVLRENGKSRGCAFLTFVNRSCAHQAIRKMNHSQMFEGCNKPLVVKFADTGRDKNTNKKSVEHNNTKTTDGLSSQTVSNLTAGVDVALTNLVNLLQQPNILPLLETARALQNLQSPMLINQNHQQSTVSLGAATLSHQSSMANVEDNGAAVQLASLQQQQQQNQHLAASPPTPSANFQTNLLNLQQKILFQQPLFTASQLAGLPFVQTTQSGPLSLGLQLIPQSLHQQLTPSSASRQNNAEKYNRGPDGCNLFIYHLPQDFTDTDLYSLFAHFGNIVSAKIFVDKQTNLSKCFGFVSFADESSAQCAISGMNGFQIGNKRLKVQLKRSDMKPYEKPNA